MPEISRFFGIIILMYFDEHNPPHFHVRYNDCRAIISINDLMITDGYLPKRAMAMVLEWANEHRTELLSNWEKLRLTGEYDKISPLE